MITDLHRGGYTVVVTKAAVRVLTVDTALTLAYGGMSNTIIVNGR